MDDVLSEVRQLVSRLAHPPTPAVWIDGMTVFESTRTTEPLGVVTEPCVVLVTQGAKRMVLGGRVYEYGAGDYLVISLELPVTTEITRASMAEPFGAFGLRLNPSILAELLADGGPTSGQAAGYSGIFTSHAADDLLDAVRRLLRMTDNGNDFHVLGPAVEREIHWRLMNGPQGETVRQIGADASQLSTIANAIRLIQAGYDQTLQMDHLAHTVGLSVSSLNRHFRAVTALSPLQYQKHLRLQKARAQLIAASDSVAAVGHAVGYDSASQFSREYRRMFGRPPREDADRFNGVVPVVA
jgi:AraC-like DNA-binding protein